MRIFGWWEEAGVNGENPHIVRENIQTPGGTQSTPSSWFNTGYM